MSPRGKGAAHGRPNHPLGVGTVLTRRHGICQHGDPAQFTERGVCTGCGRTKNEIEIDAGRDDMPRVRRAKARAEREGGLWDTYD